MPAVTSHTQVSERNKRQREPIQAIRKGIISLSDEKLEYLFRSVEQRVKERKDAGETVAMLFKELFNEELRDTGFLQETLKILEEDLGRNFAIRKISQYLKGRKRDVPLKYFFDSMKKQYGLTLKHASAGLRSLVRDHVVCLGLDWGVSLAKSAAK